MVSRLPKFGGRSPAGGMSPLSNGSTQPATPPQDVKTTPPRARPNGMIHTSPLTRKWKKDERMTLSSSTTPTSIRHGSEDKALPQFSLLGNEVQNGSPSTPRMRRSGTLMVTNSSPKTISKQSFKMSPKAGAQLGQSPLNGGPKMGRNIPSIPAQKLSDSRLVQQRLGSSSLRSSSQDSLCQSSDSLKTLELDNMVRSNSFTHFKQIPSPTSQPMTRSFSFNRAVELAKPLANTQLRPPRSAFLKPPQLSNGRVGLGLGGLNGSFGSSGGLGGGPGGLQCSRAPLGASSLPTLSIPSTPTTPSALRKPLLPNCVLTKSLSSSGGSFGYRLTRSGQAKQQKAPFPGRVSGGVRPSAAPDCGDLLAIATDMKPTGETDKVELNSDSDGSSGEDGGTGRGSGQLTQSSGRPAGETLEDMSLSSASSLDKGDISEELPDDLSTVGDALSDGDLPDNSSTTQTHLHSFNNETLDWDNMDLEGIKTEWIAFLVQTSVTVVQLHVYLSSGHEGGSPMEDSCGPLVSPEGSEVFQASSVELSPSNSSGGTYMWDEEGLEPLREPHPCDSHDDSELNSMVSLSL